MANFDLILLALIAVFIFLRLRSVLGSKDGNEDNRNHRDMFNPDPMNDQSDRMDDRDNVIHLPGSEPEVQPDQPVHEEIKEIEPVGPVQRALADIMAADPTFDQHGFVEGAHHAFDMIITAFATDDRETLKNLLTDEVYQNFKEALMARNAAGETLNTTIVGINSIEITDADLEDNMAEVTIRIISEQVNVTTDRQGEVVDGDSNYIDTITDIWTFERDVTSKSPNWFLKATQTE
ncbi:Tim44/TimA family putative adaptor protein [Terasakiella sp. A23]|uniref:Tim44/TimA family putative adaptor protein n=1 Tax=Terasakiella sp. FCG-A23 TaxID=3080561 RepID=UPI002954BE20|nr:Tim44/TimA family putative adaptor protein [Terasakiella sp. A23]MDV7339898.1 Tim44/TimA family putative adaptor protein [Terasakiella sp. A23]